MTFNHQGQGSTWDGVLMPVKRDLTSRLHSPGVKINTSRIGSWTLYQFRSSCFELCPGLHPSGHSPCVFQQAQVISQLQCSSISPSPAWTRLFSLSWTRIVLRCFNYKEDARRSIAIFERNYSFESAAICASKVA